MAIFFRLNFLKSKFIHYIELFSFVFLHVCTIFSLLYCDFLSERLTLGGPARLMSEVNVCLNVSVDLQLGRCTSYIINMLFLLHFSRYIDSNIFFEIKESKITRGHNYTLVKKQSRLDVRKYSFSQRTINVWNNLSTDCVQASSVNMFKNKIDKYLVKAGYT